MVQYSQGQVWKHAVEITDFSKITLLSSSPFIFQVISFILLCLDNGVQLSKACASSPDFSLQRANILVKLIKLQNMLGTGRISRGSCAFVEFEGSSANITLLLTL
jgi:hypothetical protein